MTRRTVSTGSDVRGLVESALAAQSAAVEQIDVAGPVVQLDAKAYTVLALVIHELVSNALRFGALSVPHGHLSVKWGLASNGLTLTWEEIGGPPARPPQSASLGINLIRRNIPHTLGGEADVQFDRKGVSARFLIPTRFMSSMTVGEGEEVPKLGHIVAHKPLEGFELLVLEDQMLLAIELEAMLRERGADAVTLAGTVDTALDLIDRKQPDAAILDFDLGDELSLPVAAELERRGVPFIFAASESDRQFIPSHFKDVVVVAKPYGGDSVADAVRDSLMPQLIRAVLTKLV